MTSKMSKSLLILLISLFATFLSSDIVRASTVDVNTAPSAIVSDSLYFPASVTAFAKAEIEKQKTFAQTFLRDAAKKANSLQITVAKNNFKQSQVSKYATLAAFLPDLSVRGSGDWGSKSVVKEFVPSKSSTPTSHLVTLATGNCRLSWSLFNSDTWFEPDCRLKIATPRQFLQVALIDYNQHAAPMTTSGYFIELESLNALATSTSDYKIKSGSIFSPDLDPMLAYTGLALRFRSVDGTTGYDIKIDPIDKRHFTFSLSPPDNQLKASWSRVVIVNGVKTLTFDQPSY